MSNYNPTPRIENIAHEAIQILNTLALLDQAYSMGYVVRILQADERYKFRKVAHRDLETFGTLEDLNFSRIEDIMHHLVHLGLIEVKNQLYGTVALTDQGREFLVKPYDIEVAQSDLYRGWAVMPPKRLDGPPMSFSPTMSWTPSLGVCRPRLNNSTPFPA